MVKEIFRRNTVKNIDVEYETVSEGSYFRFFGANSGNGYINTPDERLREQNCDVKILIKGGPGTGKSTLIRKFADTAKDSGYGVTRYLCSSDPHSYDAVSAEKDGRRIVICDATAPHVCDMQYPGAKSFIFDLSEYWDRAALISESDKIVELTERKRTLYESSYKFLRAASGAQKNADSLSESVFNFEKADGFCERTASRFKRDRGNTLSGYTSALSMSGAVTLDSLYAESSFRIFTDDNIGVSKFLLGMLARKLNERGSGCFVALDPLDGSVESILVLKDKTLITRRSIGNADKIINCERFVAKPASGFKNRLKLVKGCVSSLVREALAFLVEASKYHFELEKIYSSSMDFNRSEAAAIKRIYGILT